MGENEFDSNLIELMVEETLSSETKFSVSFDEYSMAYKLKINQVYLEIPSNWSCLETDKSGEICLPQHLLDVIESEVDLGLLESISIVQADDESLQLRVHVSALRNLNAA